MSKLTFRSDEPPSRIMPQPTVKTIESSITTSVSEWENGFYGGWLRRFASGFPLGDGPYAILSITAIDQTSRHDWRDFQQLKNLLLGPEWEAVELYPAESKLIDPSNRFYLWCVPGGTIPWGLPGERRVSTPEDAMAPQRAFGKRSKD
jgi:hypothetical protein